MAETPKIAPKTHVAHATTVTRPDTGAKKVDKPIPFATQAKEACSEVPTKLPETTAGKKIFETDYKLGESCKKLTEAKNPEEKAKIQKEIVALEAEKTKKQETASLRATDDGRIEITLLKDTPAKDLKETFKIADGTFRKNQNIDLQGKPESNPEGLNGDNQGSTKANYDSHKFTKGQKIVIDSYDMNPQGFVEKAQVAISRIGM